MWEEEMLATHSEQGLCSWCQLFAQSTKPPVLLCTPTEHIPRDWIMKLSLAPFFTDTSPLPPTFLFISQATYFGNVFSCAFLTILLGASPLVCIQGQTKVFIGEGNYFTKSRAFKQNAFGSLLLLCDLLIDTLFFSSDYVPWGSE